MCHLQRRSVFFVSLIQGKLLIPRNPNASYLAKAYLERTAKQAREEICLLKDDKTPIAERHKFWASWLDAGQQSSWLDDENSKYTDADKVKLRELCGKLLQYAGSVKQVYSRL